MNILNLNTENKAVFTNVVFSTSQEAKVIALQIKANELLKEHITPVPALLVCINGKAEYQDEKSNTIALHVGDTVKIEPNVKHWVSAALDSNFLLIK